MSNKNDDIDNLRKEINRLNMQNKINDEINCQIKNAIFYNKDGQIVAHNETRISNLLFISDNLIYS